MDDFSKPLSAAFTQKNERDVGFQDARPKSLIRRMALSIGCLPGPPPFCAGWKW